MYLLLLGSHETHQGQVSVDAAGNSKRGLFVFPRRWCGGLRFLEVDLVSGLKASGLGLHRFLELPVKKGPVPLGGAHQAACVPLRTEGTMHLGRSPYGPKSAGIAES